jgi:hypothetical protein
MGISMSEDKNRLTAPDHIIELANNVFRQAFGRRALVGKPDREAAPKQADQLFFDWLDTVYRTGEIFHGQDVLAYLHRINSGRLDPYYYNFTSQATRYAAGAMGCTTSASVRLANVRNAYGKGKPAPNQTPLAARNSYWPGSVLPPASTSW